MKNINYTLPLLITGIFLGVIIAFSAFHVSFQTILTLPSADEPSTSASTDGGELINGKIDINSASAETLQILPGIGVALSQRIVEYRQSHGPFTSKDDLLEVKGIGEKLLNKIEPYITIGGQK